MSTALVSENGGVGVAVVGVRNGVVGDDEAVRVGEALVGELHLNWFIDTDCHRLEQRVLRGIFGMTSDIVDLGNVIFTFHFSRRRCLSRRHSTFLLTVFVSSRNPSYYSSM